MAWPCQLCQAHPGGGVMGAPGRNCATQVIRDRSKRKLTDGTKPGGDLGAKQ